MQVKSERDFYMARIIGVPGVVGSTVNTNTALSVRLPVSPMAVQLYSLESDSPTEQNSSMEAVKVIDPSTMMVSVMVILSSVPGFNTVVPFSSNRLHVKVEVPVLTQVVKMVTSSSTVVLTGTITSSTVDSNTRT